jgi:NAD(P)H-nitrite reductase large subunit
MHPGLVRIAPSRLNLKLDVIIMGPVEGGSPLASETSLEWSRTMERCECAEMSFDEVVRRIQEEGLSLEEIAERTGCGRMCSACLPDPRRRLARPR